MSKVKCERTKKPIQMIDGFFVANSQTGEWRFVAEDAPEEHGDYNVAVKRMLSSPEAFCDWMAHIAEKTWFKPEKFFDFFTRLREKNNLYNQN